MLAANCCGLPLIGVVMGFLIGRGYRIRFEKS
jgi:hypothetical protein